MEGPPRGSRRRWIYVVLVAPYVGLLVPAWYAHADPRLAGIPFYLWYQFLWVLLGVAVTATVYALTRGEDGT